MSQNFIARPSFVRFKVLVVDDDSTSLSIISAMLKQLDYDVMTVKRPVDALATIRIQQDIDIVLTDLHMPEMNGIQLQKQISEEFNNLPVIVMSSDDRESVIMKSLDSGVVLYVVKPVNSGSFKNIWRYAITSNIGKSLFNINKDSSADDKASSSFDEMVSASAIIKAAAEEEEEEEKKQWCNKKNSKRNASKRGNYELQVENINVTALKKAKVVWTNSLHNRFLQAIRYISLEKAVPKKILEFMNVPGLTRENVASHLQKYRNFLKRVAEKGTSVTSKHFSHRSRFASAHSLMALQEANESAQTREKQQQVIRRSPLFLPQYNGGGDISALNGNNNNNNNFGSTGFPSLGASSSSNSVSQANFQQSFFGNTTDHPVYQANHGTTTFATGSTDMGGNLFSSTNSNQMSQQKSQTMPESYHHNNNNIRASFFKGFDTSGWNPTNTSVLENIGTISNNPNSNYTGIQLNDDGELVGAAGKTSPRGYGMINGSAGNNEAVTAAGLMGNATVHNLSPGESSSSSSAITSANEQENTSMLLLPQLSSQQHGIGGNNAQNGLMNIDNYAQNEQFGESMDFDSLLFDPSDYQILFQPRREGGPNPNFSNGSSTSQSEPNHPINQWQNLELYESFAARSPWNEATVEQLQEIQEVVNPETGSSNAQPLNDYYPSFDQNPYQQGNQNNINYELDGSFMEENSFEEIQGWDNNDFIDSLFRDYPY